MKQSMKVSNRWTFSLMPYYSSSAIMVVFIASRVWFHRICFVSRKCTVSNTDWSVECSL